MQNSTYRANKYFLLNKSAETCSMIVAELFYLPLEKRYDVGILATLLNTNEYLVLLRELPPSKPKILTRWEQFTKAYDIDPFRKRLLLYINNLT